jgi:hypothetical protein
MKTRHFGWATICGLVVGVGWAITSWSSPQGPSSATVPVKIVVSVEAKHGKEVPEIHREDVRVYQGKDRVQVTAWVPLQGDEAELELYVLIDDAAEMNIGLQYDDLRQFMNAQPATTAIAVGYIRFGTVEIVQKLTKGHSQAAKALRLPMGVGAGIGSPYVSVEDLIKRWPESGSRHEILMVTSGIDRLQGGPSDPYLQGAIERAQQAGVQVYAIYVSGEGHFGHSFRRFNWGQNNLSQLTDETGGEFYVQGFQTPVAFKPFLDELSYHLNHQYRLTFLSKPEKKVTFQHVRLETEVPNAELVAADRVYVPAAK